MDLKKIFNFSAIYTMLAGLEKGVMLLLLPIVTTHLTVYQYGVVSTVVMLTSFLGSLMSLSLHGALFRYYYRYTQDLRNVLVSTIFSFLMFTSLVSVTLIVITGWFYNSNAETELPFNPYWLFIAFISTSLSIITFTLNVLKISENLSFLVKFSTAKTLLMAVLMLYFIVVIEGGDVAYLYGMSITLVFMVLVSIAYILKNYGIKFELRMLRKSLAYSLPIVPISISNLIGNLIDRFYILQFLGVASVGTYYLGIQITSIILIIMLAINSAYVPMFYRQVRNKPGKKFYFYSDIYILISFLLSVFTLIISDIFIRSYLSPEYYSVLNVLPLLLIIATINSLYVLNTNLLSLRKKLVKLKTYIVTFGLLTNMGLGWLLTSEIGIIGAALSTLLSSLLVVILFMYSNYKNNNICYENYKHLFLFAVNTIVLLLIGYCIDTLIFKLCFMFCYSLCLLSYIYKLQKNNEE